MCEMLYESFKFAIQVSDLFEVLGVSWGKTRQSRVGGQILAYHPAKTEGSDTAQGKLASSHNQQTTWVISSQYS